jgi:hypothetical protein
MSNSTRNQMGGLDPFPAGATCGVCGSLVENPTAGDLIFIALEEHDPIKLREPELRGKFVPLRFLKTPALTASALYTERDSLARKSGMDLLFLCCSEACGLRLSEAIVTDAQFFSKLIEQQ